MKKLCFAIILLLLGQNLAFAYEKELKELSATLADSIAKSGKKSVAVMDFSDLQGNVTDGGRLFAEEFTVNLAESEKGFKVIERSRLSTILAEYKLASTGIIDPNTAKKLGQIAGVDAIVTGIVTPLGDNMRLSIKVIAVDTAEIIGATSGNVPITKPLQELFSITPLQIISEPNSQPSSEAELLSKTIAKQQFKDYIFELKACVLLPTNEGIVCALAITNQSPDKELCILDKWSNNRYSRIIGEHGEEFKVTDIHLGAGKQEKACSTLVSGIPILTAIMFRTSNVGSKISLLEIGCRDEYNKEFVVQFKNIPVTKLPTTQTQSQALPKTNMQTASESKPQNTAKLQVKDYIFELKGCKLMGDKVVCEVLIINRSSDIEMTMWFPGSTMQNHRYSRIIDDTGNEYRVERMNLGSSSGGFNWQGRFVSSILVSGVPTKSAFLFSGVNQNIKRLSLLEIGCEDERNKDFVAQFRNIPLTKEQ